MASHTGAWLKLQGVSRCGSVTYGDNDIEIHFQLYSDNETGIHVQDKFNGINDLRAGVVEVKVYILQGVVQ